MLYHPVRSHRHNHSVFSYSIQILIKEFKLILCNVTFVENFVAGVEDTAGLDEKLTAKWGVYDFIADILPSEAPSQRV